MRLLVIGTGSHFAGALLPTLLRDVDVQHVIGLDQHSAERNDPRYTHVIADLKSAQVTRLMAGVQAAVLLGSPALTIAAVENVVHGAYQQGLRCLVYVSSGWVYTLPTRERPVSEQHARAGGPWGEAAFANAVEDLLDRLELGEQRTRIVRLRPALMVGRYGSPWARALLKQFFTVHFASRAPRLQCVHADDVAQAAHQALLKDVRGAFNLATSDHATLRDMQRRLHRGWFPLPSSVMRAVSRQDHEPSTGHSGRLEALHHELVLDTTRARRLLGWRPHHDTIRACLKAFNA
jgi:UDP-glucose 4-epimerase